MTDTMDPAAVAQFLVDHPQFFEQHAALLGQVKLSSPLTGKTVSLQERQMEVMRDKYKALELQMAELIRLAQDNAAIANKFHGWTQALLQARHGADLPRALVDGLCAQFAVPQATLRLWDLAPDHAGALVRPGRVGRRPHLRQQPAGALLRQQPRLRSGALARRRRRGAVDRDPAAAQRRRRLRPADPRLARSGSASAPTWRPTS